jgi:hypothetical protein
VLTFLLGYVAQGLTLWRGWLVLGENWTFIDTIIFCLIVAIPGIAAVVARVASSGFKTPVARVWPLPAIATLRMMAVVFAVFALAYTLASIIGLTQPDWTLGELIVELKQQSARPIPPEVLGILPSLLLVLSLICIVALGATVFAGIAFLAEYGWRGYLYQQFLALGVVPAAIITGVLWWAFFLPTMFMSFNLMDNADKMTLLASFAARSLAMAIALSFFLGAIMRRTNHVGLVAIGVGSIVAHQSILWEQLFPTDVMPWTGPFGLILVALWFFASLVPSLITGRASGAREEMPAAEGVRGSA